MAAKYQVNIDISAGTDFSQEFYIVNPDSTPRDVSGCKVCANLSKHAVSLDAVNSTENHPVYKVIPFYTRIVDGQKGIVSISLNVAISSKIKEGKYVYDVVLQTPNGGYESIVSGLAFVQRSFGAMPVQGIFDGGNAGGESSGVILDGGGAYVEETIGNRPSYYNL